MINENEKVKKKKKSKTRAKEVNLQSILTFSVQSHKKKYLGHYKSHYL